jgi:hypothetical protein
VHNLHRIIFMAVLGEEAVTFIRLQAAAMMTAALTS